MAWSAPSECTGLSFLLLSDELGAHGGCWVEVRVSVFVGR
jgi:hypothetical protein